MDFLEIISGPKLWYLEENVGPWDPDRFFKITSGSRLWYLEENEGPWDPDGIFQNDIGFQTLVFGGKYGTLGPRWNFSK